MLDVEVYSRDLTKVTRRLAKAGSPLMIRAEIRGGMVAIGPQARMVVASAARSLPAYGKKHTGLRQRMAKAAMARTVNDADGPTLVVGIRRDLMGPQRALPRLIEAGSWRHPLFGNTKHWYTQTGTKGWFSDAINNGVVPLMEEAMDETARKIAESLVS